MRAARTHREKRMRNSTYQMCWTKVKFRNNQNLFWASTELPAVVMFLWWSKKKDGIEATIDETQHEIEELRTELTTSTLTRPSPVSKARYNKWVVAEDNRTIGEKMRLENDEFTSQRESTRNEFMEAGHERAQAAREQREAAGERVRQHRADSQARAAEIKSEMEERNAHMREVKASWQQQAVRNAHIYGTEQRDRVLEERARTEESRRHAAMTLKQNALDRQEDFKASTARSLEEKRQRVARIRAETRPEVVQAAKAYFYERRKDVADDVRQSVRTWKSEASYRQQDALERARVNHEAGVQSRENAIDGKRLLQEHRRQEAGEVRDSIKVIELHREHLKLSAEAAKREVHDDAFESKFVPPPQAQIVETSAIDQVANSHRDELAAREGQLPRPRQGANWNTFFGNTNHDGFFNSWFSEW
jgi:hypothetical protein